MILFNQPYLAGTEEQNIKQVIANGYFCGNGDYSKACEDLLKQKYQAQTVLLTSSCTAALEISAQLLGLAPGDEVIMPSFTHVGTATAFARQGVNIVWCDIEADTKNIDDDKLAGLITPNTKAVVVVHYCGAACNMLPIKALCQQHGIALIEDNAAGIGATYKNQHLGTFGDFSTLSFHQTKNIHCGEGGAFIVNNPALADAAATIRDRGTNRLAFEKKHVQAYTWQLPGSNYYPSELQAAFLKAQLDNWDKVTTWRLKLYSRYLTNLQSIIPACNLPGIIPGAEPNGHAFYFLCKSKTHRKQLIADLHKVGVQSAFHYQPLHLAPYWNGIYQNLDLPVTSSVADCLLRLPLHYQLAIKQIDYICEHVQRFYNKEQL